MTYRYLIAENRNNTCSVQLNLAYYSLYRGEFIKDIRKLAAKDRLIIVENVFLANKTSENNKNIDIKTLLLFLSDLFSIMNRYPQSLSIGSKAIKLTPLSKDRISSETLINALKLIKLADKTDLSIQRQEQGVEKAGQKDPESCSEHISQSYLDAEYELMQKGYRRAGKYECNSYEEAKAINKVMKKTFPYTQITISRENQIDIYYSLHKEYLDKITNSDNVLSDEHIKNSGWLFGYPECCTKEYLKSGFQYLPSFPYKWLIRRYQTRGEIDPLFNPFLSNLYYFPCHLRCNETLRRLRIIGKHIISREKSDLLYMPVIFFLPESLNPSTVRGSAGNMEYVLINPVSEKGDTIKYKPVDYGIKTEKTEIIRRGDSLTLKDGVMAISRGDKVIHRFSLEAGIWYYKKTFDNDFFNIFIRLLLSAVKYRPVTIKKDIFDEDFIKIKSCLQNNTAIFRKYNITINHINIYNNEITIDIKFGRTMSRRVILAVQRASPYSKYFVRGKKYIISVKECNNNTENNVLYPLSSLILNLIEN